MPFIRRCSCAHANFDLDIGVRAAAATAVVPIWDWTNGKLDFFTEDKKGTCRAKTLRYLRFLLFNLFLSARGRPPAFADPPPRKVRRATGLGRIASNQLDRAHRQVDSTTGRIRHDPLEAGVEVVIDQNHAHGLACSVELALRSISSPKGARH